MLLEQGERVILEVTKFLDEQENTFQLPVIIKPYTGPPSYQRDSSAQEDRRILENLGSIRYSRSQPFIDASGLADHGADVRARGGTFVKTR